VVWQHVIGMECVLLAVLSATRTQHSEQYAYHTHDMLPYQRVTYTDVVFFFIYRILTFSWALMKAS